MSPRAPRAGESGNPPPLHRLAALHGDRDSDAVALTFDDGPVPATEQVLRILEDGGAKGTFFLVGRKIPGNEALVRSIARAGHQVGNHSFHHQLRPSIHDIDSATALIRSVTGSAPRVYRPPFGAIDQRTSAALRAKGMTSVRWDVDSEDVFPIWEGIPAQEIYDRVIGGIRPGSIVLMHDGCLWSNVVEALHAIVATLAERGYRMVTVSELLDAPAQARASGGRWEPRRGGAAEAQASAGRRARSIGGAWRRRRHGSSEPTPVVDHERPVSEEQLAAMRPREVVELLEGLEPAHRHGPAFEGTARLLSERVVENPAAFAEHADRLVELGPATVAASLRGLEIAVHKWRGVRWSGALRLIEATLPGSVSDGTAPIAGRTPDVNRARESALALLEAGLEHEVVPADLRARLWHALEELSWDFEAPDTDAPARRGSAEAVRAGAVGTIVRYAAWLRNGSGRADQANPPGTEVRTSLDAHLDPSREPSPRVRAAYGLRLPLLYEAEPEWLAKRLDLIFPTTGERSAERLAAWDAFLVWGQPTPELFTLLEDRYRLALGDLPTPPHRRRPGHDDPGRALARHLEALYRAGAIALEDDGLLHAFAQRAGAHELAYLVRAVGMFLHRDDAGLDHAVAGRLIELWDRLLEWTSHRQEADRRTVLEPFGLWHAGGALDADWADDRLDALLRQGITAEPEFSVLEQLAERAPIRPGRAVELAGLYVELIDDPWRLFSVRDALATVLEAGGAASDAEVQARARAVERAATARGFPDFPSLLKAA